MGKKLVIMIFIGATAVAFYLFLSRDTRFLREKIQETQVKEARVVLEDFTVFRYNDKRLIARLDARLGHFYEPNVLELNGEIKGERLGTNGKETFGAESVIAYFEAKTINDMLKNATLRLAELTGFVEVGVKNHLLTTDYAEYRAKESVVASTRPVRVEGTGRVFTGEEGFIYNLEPQTLDILGHVEGMVKSIETDQ